MPEIHLCTITKIEKPTAYAFSITVQAPELSCSARPGQFVHVKCGHSRLLRRPVSICAVDGDELTIIFEPRGEGTQWLSARKQGQTLDILGPLGHGFSLPDGNIVVVGGGIGVPPMLYAASAAAGSVTAILGFRDSSRILLRNEFGKVCENVYITTDDGSSGIHGTVSQPLEELLKNGGVSAVLACGPRVMLSAVAGLCGRYETPCQVSLEERMGCGVGACLVCACMTVRDGNEHMARVCKDGPVFNAQEVAW